MAIVGAAVIAAGCTSIGDGPARTTLSPAAPSTVLTTPKTESSTTTEMPPTTEVGYPVLLALPEIPLEELALIELQTWHYMDGGKTVVTQPDVPGIRILSPNGDADPVNALLLDYEGIELQPTAGFPHPGNLSARAVFRLKDGSSIAVAVEDATDRLVVAFDSWGVSPQDWNAPHALGYSRSFASAVAAVGNEAARTFPPDFTLPAAMPDDFSLTFAYGVTLRNVLDTASGLFTKDLVSERLGTVTTNLALTEEELASLYADLRQLDIGTYVGVFVPGSAAGSGHTPYVSYYLHVRACGQEKEIFWEDNSDSAERDAVALRTFFARIQAIIEGKPEYQELPQAKGGYAHLERVAAW